MPLTPAVCPACGRVMELNIAEMPSGVVCAGCGQALTPRVMGAAVILSPSVSVPVEKDEVTALLAKADKAEPEEQFALITQALKIDPLSFGANRALLFLGDLYQRRKRVGDFSLFKAYLLHMYEEPQQYKQAKLDNLRAELFAHPQLQRTLVLCADQDAFMEEYLLTLARTYVNLFISPRSSISHSFFGFTRSQDSIAKGSAQVVRSMLDNVAKDETITPQQRDKLAHALQRAYEEAFPGQRGLLD